MGVLLSLENRTEEWAASCEDYSVSFNLLFFLAHQSNIGVVVIFPQFLEGTDNILLEFIPLQTEFLGGVAHVVCAGF